MKWLMSFPVWGDQHRDLFRTKAWPSIRIALDEVAPAEIRAAIEIVIHTDRHGFADDLLGGLNARYVNVSGHAFGPSPHLSYGDAHRDVCQMAEVGDWISCLNADFVVSHNLFSKCVQHVCSGKQAITGMGIRTLIGDYNPPAGATPRALLSWGWDHRHQIIRNLEWGTGNSDLPTNIFWVNDDQVVGRAYHLHPVLVVKRDNQLGFSSTIDAEAIDSYPREVIHVVTDADDLAFIEMSFDSKKQETLPLGSTMNPEQVASKLKSWQIGSRLYKWQLGQRIVIKGAGWGIDEKPVINSILEHLG